MNLVLPLKQADARVGEIIKVAVMAVGGQGGGVLTSWIEAMARSQGYACQGTSVAGVAQRTGTTIYYVEMTPESDQQPIFALAPVGGDVDVLIAAERCKVDPGDWQKLGVYAALTYVPETDASRMAGAGAGLTDND